jgi:hypothetical protein
MCDRIHDPPTLPLLGAPVAQWIEQRFPKRVYFRRAMRCEPEGRSPVLWAFFGLVLGIFGVIFALIARPRHA